MKQSQSLPNTVPAPYPSAPQVQAQGIRPVPAPVVTAPAPTLSRQPHPQAVQQNAPQQAYQQPAPAQQIAPQPVQQAVPQPQASPYPQAPAHAAPQQQAQQPQVQQHAPQPLAQQQTQPQYQAAPMNQLGGQIQQNPHAAQAQQAAYGEPELGYSQNPLMPTAAPVLDPLTDGGERALPRIAIHAFCERNETAGAVQAMSGDWRMSRANLKVYMGGLLAAAEYYKNESTPSLVMVESALQGPQLFEQLEQLAAVVDEGTKVVLIGASNDIRLYRELMEKGLSDYIVPPFHPISFIRAIGELYADPDKPFVGRIVAFFGAKGGVGSSTLSHNVAWALSAKMDQETALIDLDSSWGTTGLDFNYDSTQGLEEALAETDRLDEALLDKIMVRHTEKLTILPASSSLGAPAPNDSEAYAKLIDGVRSLSPLTIVDMPHIWSEWSSDILVRAEDVVITATPDLANLRNTKNLVDFLKAARPNDNLPLLVLNKTGVPKTAEIPVKDFAAAVGLDPALVLAYEPVAYTEASNDGKMLCDISATSSAFDGILYLAARLRTGKFQDMSKAKKGFSLGLGKKKKTAPIEAGDQSGEGKTSFLSKLTKRK